MEYYKNLDLTDIRYFCEIDRIEKREKWLPVVGYEGIYEISDLGRIKSLDIYHPHYMGGFSFFKERIKKSSISKGYLVSGLTKGGDLTTIKTHRLVAIAFILNPENKPEVNNKFGNKKDNRAIVLEWSTSSENIKHAHKTGLHKGSHFGLIGKLNPNGKSVIQYDLLGNFIE